MSRPEFGQWLSHLRRDRRGLPVPYINLWGQEDPCRVSIAYDLHAGRRAFFLDDSAETVPDFTRQHMARQRECMAAGLCQVCARPVPWSRRNLVVADLSVEWISLPGHRWDVPVVIEPWLDDRCADIAVNWCPALIRRSREEELHVVPVRSARDVQMVVSVGYAEGDLEEESRRDPPAMWIKVALVRDQIRRKETGT